MSIEVGFGLEAALGSATAALEKNTATNRRVIDTLKAATPVDLRFNTAGTSASSGDLTLVYYGPDTGFFWHVRRIIVGGANWSSVVAGTAEVFVTALSSTSYSRDLADQVDQASQLPNKAFYGQHELFVQANENLLIVIHSPTATTLYKSSIQVQQFRTIPENIDYMA